MPRSFPDIDSLRRAATNHNFRQPDLNEPEECYREALANFVSSIDMVESQEIRTSHAWDTWSDQEKLDLLQRKMSKHG